MHKYICIYTVKPICRPHWASHVLWREARLATLPVLWAGSLAKAAIKSAVNTYNVIV